MARCEHPAMVPSAKRTRDGRVYSHCPDCDHDYHPDSRQVSGEPSDPPPEPVIE